MTETITHTPGTKRLERSRTHSVIAGVCGGLGEYFDLNPIVFRLGLVVLTLLGGAGVLVYLAAVLVMPAADKEASIAEEILAQRREHPGRLIGLALVGVAIFVLLSQAHTWPSTGAGWVLVLIAGLVILWTNRAERKRRLFIGIVATLVLLAATVVACIVAAFAAFNVSLNDGVGDRVYTPSSIADVQRNYELGVGNLRVDLSQVPLTQDLRVRANVGIGELRVIVPAGATVVSKTHVKAGDITGLRVTTGSGRTVYLDLHVGAGHIDIERGA